MRLKYSSRTTEVKRAKAIKVIVKDSLGVDKILA